MERLERTFLSNTSLVIIIVIMLGITFREAYSMGQSDGIERTCQEILIEDYRAFICEEVR